ncbi:MAG: 2-phospho-L-lactate transferase [Pseudomonadales bacterium]
MADYLAITGGVGGAKLSLGLAQVLDPERVVFAVNTGDDFEHLGFAISPDIDTLTYTLAGLANPKEGWGRHDETWSFMETLERLGGETWFRLGDRDLALHAHRTAALTRGRSLTEVTADIAGRLGVAHRILPMSDHPVRTTILTADGELAFQHYFVRDRCAPHVTGFEFRGARQAQLNPEITALLPSLKGIIICPSNPFVSVDPLLAIADVRQQLAALDVPIVAVSPIVGGIAIKGPTAKMMAELAIPSTAAAVADHYGDLLDGFVLDEQDRALHGTLAVPTVVTPTVMVSLADRIALARATLEFVDSLA